MEFAHSSIPIIFTGIFDTLWLPFLISCVLTSYLFWRIFHPPIQNNSFKVVNVKDRLSELPIVVSSQILSLVSIRDVARIATLSRHWRNVCLALPCLHLDWYAIAACRRPISSEKLLELAYVNNVDHILEIYRNQNIQSFRLSCFLNAKIYGAVIDRWMSFVAANKGLHTLTIQFLSYNVPRGFLIRSQKHPDFCVVSSFLSQFSQLRSLHLDTCILRLEKEFKLPNLTSLDLDNIILEESNWQGVLTCSSIIQHLWLRRCKLPSKLCIGNDFPCLSFLMIVDCQDLRELEVSAFKLQKFDLQTSEHLKCSFVNVPNLEQVYLFPWYARFAEDIFNNLAANAPRLKSLFVREICSVMHKLPSSKSNFFYSVSRLRIFMNNDDGRILKNLPHLLKCFPQLKELEIKLPPEPLCKTYELPVLHTHTKLEYITIFQLHVEYIPVAIYLLKSACVLKRMVVTIASNILFGYENLHWFYNNKRYSFKERLVIQIALIGKASSTKAELIVK